MKIETNSRYRIVEYAGMIILLLLLFWRIRHAIFGAQEEYGLFYIVQKGDFFAWLNSISRETGRITFYILGWFWAGPMFFSDPIVYKLSMYILISIDFACFFWLLRCHVDRRFAVFAISFILIMMQISNQHNLLITYNYLHIPFILLTVSTHLILNYCKGKSGYGAVIGSSICSFIASFFQENFVLFYILCFAIVFHYEKGKKIIKRIWSSLWKLKFHVLGGAVFLIIYFSFRMMCSMGNYAGNTVCFSYPMISLEVLLTFITGMIPGRTFMDLGSLIGYDNVLAFVGKKDLVLIITETLFLCLLLYHLPKFKKSANLFGGLVLAAILACGLHSLSLQYITWVSSGNTYAYVPSYYSAFFMDTIICLVIHGIYVRVKRKWKYVVLILFAVFTFVFSAMTVAVNKYYDREYGVEFSHYESYREFFQNCDIENWQDEAQVLIIDDYPVDVNLIHQAMTTVRYDAYYFTVTNDSNAVEKSKDCYVLTYENGEISLKIE